MIDFEVLGDLLRKAKIPHNVKMMGSPVITVVAKMVGDLSANPNFQYDDKKVDFTFDGAGNLKGLRVRE